MQNCQGHSQTGRRHGIPRLELRIFPLEGTLLVPTTAIELYNSFILKKTCRERNPYNRLFRKPRPNTASSNGGRCLGRSWSGRSDVQLLR